MKNKILMSIFAGMFFLVIGFGFVLSVESNYCCERLDNGAWCQNAPQDRCDEDYRSVPTSCEATSYCRMGCCYDSQEGTCMENSPQKVCEDSGGVWEESASCEIPQCELGCCLLGDQAAFVTQIRCKRLSALYGLEINYRTDISNEMQCIASATSDAKGACVFERDFEKTCIFTTQKECESMSGTNSSNVEFHKGFLCSAESLGTNCGPTEETTCVEGEDEVYFVDSCGNLANIYDANKIKDKNYWSEIKRKDESCNPSSSNADSASCGNCDYFLGSTCKAYERNQDRVRPRYGDNICRDLSCSYEGKNYEHGETWCANAPGTEDNSPGSRYFRLICYNGEVTVEPCADFRQEYCLESDIDGFSTAACVVNKWQDDEWGSEESTEEYDVPPGLEFWNFKGDADEICSQGTVTCDVGYEKGLLGDWECVTGCECLSSSWEEDMMQECVKLGDCGEQQNYLGYWGGKGSGDGSLWESGEEDSEEKGDQGERKDDSRNEDE